MKKSLHIVEALAGGILFYLSELTSGLVDEYEITILYGVRPETPDNIEDYFDEKINLVKVDNFTRQLNLISDLKAYNEIKKRIDSINPDVIHLHSSKAGALGRLLKYKKNQKIFYTPHGYSFLMQNNGKLKPKIYLLIEKILGLHNAVTIACSKGEFIESKKVTRKATYINNAVDIGYLHQFVNKKSNSENSFFTIGRIDEQKNPRLFNEIALQNPEKSFLWIGDGKMRNILTSSNIEVTGWLSRDEVLTKMQPYKCFLLTSKWEGLPISLLEAMYYGKICYATNVIGNKDTISNKKNGYLFTTAKDFNSLITNDVKNIDVGNFAHEEIKKNYNTKKMIQLYKKQYIS